MRRIVMRLNVIIISVLLSFLMMTNAYADNYASNNSLSAKCDRVSDKCKIVAQKQTNKKNNYIRHDEKGNICYKNYRKSLYTPFSLNVMVKGNELIVEGKLDKSINAGEYVKVKGRKHIFTLTSKTKYWAGYYIGKYTKKQFITACNDYMKNRENAKYIWLSIEMREGTVYRVGTAPFYIWEFNSGRYYDMDHGWIER